MFETEMKTNHEIRKIVQETVETYILPAYERKRLKDRLDQYEDVLDLFVQSFHTSKAIDSMVDMFPKLPMEVWKHLYQRLSEPEKLSFYFRYSFLLVMILKNGGIDKEHEVPASAALLLQEVFTTIWYSQILHI